MVTAAQRWLARRNAGPQLHTEGIGSPARRAATNRANSLHSTGPRTEQGKQRSSQNALRHGATSSNFSMRTPPPPHRDSTGPRNRQHGLAPQPHPAARSRAVLPKPQRPNPNPAQASDKGYSNETLRGSYAQTGSGVITAPADQAGPFANVGTLIFDGNGGLTGVIVVNGSSAEATETGTYKVNPDCTGTYTVEIDPFGITSNAFFAIDTNGDEFGSHRDRPGLRDHLRREEVVSRKSHLKA